MGTGKSYKAKRVRRFRVRLFGEQGGLCHWCKRPMRMDPDGTGIAGRDAATIDHIYPRGHPMRGKTQRGERINVLACRLCNHRRNVEFTAARPIEELWAASGRPKGSGVQ